MKRSLAIPGHLDQDPLRCVRMRAPAMLFRLLRGLQRPRASLPRPWVGVLAAVALAVTAPPGEAMTVEAAPLDVLVREADAVVRGVVTATRAEEPFPSRRQVWTRATIALDDVAWGPRALAVDGTLELLLPGGETEALGTFVPGVPRLTPGDTVVLLLSRRGQAWQPIGYSLGALFVDDAGRLWRAGARGRPHTLVPAARWESLTVEALGGP